MNRLKQQSSLLTVWGVNSLLNLMLFKLIREKVEARNVSLDHFTYCRKPPDFLSVFLYKKEDWKEGLESEDTTHGMGRKRVILLKNVFHLINTYLLMQYDFDYSLILSETLFN